MFALVLSTCPPIRPAHHPGGVTSEVVQSKVSPGGRVVRRAVVRPAVEGGSTQTAALHSGQFPVRPTLACLASCTTNMSTGRTKYFYLVGWVVLVVGGAGGRQVAFPVSQADRVPGRQFVLPFRFQNSRGRTPIDHCPPGNHAINQQTIRIFPTKTECLLL